VTDPVRTAPPLAAIATCTFPLSEPLADAGKEIQDALVDAVQAQPASVVMPIVADPPAAAMEIEVGLTANVHAAAACVTVTAWPATSTLPLRAEVTGLAETENVTVPLPLPDAPFVIEIHDSGDATVQVQVLDVVTAADPVPPAGP